MFKIVCLLAGLAVAYGSECERLHGGECHDMLDGCPSRFQYYTYNYCGFMSHCCYNADAGHVTAAPATSAPAGSCGISAINGNHRIVGGTIASNGAYPWQVSVRHHGYHLCGGTLIDSQHVLTAAHCFENDERPTYWTVGVGTNDQWHISGSRVRSVTHVHVHSHYSKSTHHNDIAIMRLSSPLDLKGVHIRAACLPEAGDSFEHETCTVTGWGHTSEGGSGVRYLKEVDLPVISNSMCSYYLGRYAGIIDTQICAGELEGGKDSCQGDSGGPLVCQKDGVWKLAGVVSWGYGCAQRYTPGVYTRVSKYLDWIETTKRN